MGIYNRGELSFSRLIALFGEKRDIISGSYLRIKYLMNK